MDKPVHILAILVRVWVMLSYIEVCLFVSFTVFRDKPLLPPSKAQQSALKAAANENYLKSIVNLFTNFGFVILVIAYGKLYGDQYISEFRQLPLDRNLEFFIASVPTTCTIQCVTSSSKRSGNSALCND
jgi:hypothetical protein